MTRNLNYMLSNFSILISYEYRTKKFLCFEFFLDLDVFTTAKQNVKSFIKSYILNKSEFQQFINLMRKGK